METCVTSLMLAFLWHGVTASVCDYSGDVTVQRDTYLQAPILSSLSGLGLSMCERKCFNVTGSLSFNYFHPDGKCECLGETNASSAHALVSWKGWHHGNVATSNHVSGTNCTCADGKACVLDMPGLIRCPVACPPPPPLSGSTAHVTAVSPTAAASYTCLEDFTFFGSSSHVTCTAEGTWEGLNGTCKRTSWTNPTQMVFAIPEPVEACWRVETVFLLTTTAVTHILLQDGDDYRLVISIRVNFEGQNYTQMNSRYGNVWETRVNSYSVPWRTGVEYNVSVVVSSPDVGFEVFVDGMLHGTYKHDYKPCTPLNEVTIEPGMDLYSLRMVYP